MHKSKIYFVGAGPGDPALITLRGAQLLRQADCVIYDGLVNEVLLEDCRPNCECLCVRKRTGEKPFTQEQINQLLVEKAAQYRTVVRLKGGDPGFFGRTAEEIQTCIQGKIDFEVVPGVTAASAAAAYSGLFLTDRQFSSQVLFVTGQEAPDKNESSIDWDFLAGFRGTIAFYMAMSNLEQIAAALLANGKPADTPAAVIQNASLPHQRLVQASLERIAAVCRQEGMEAPAIVLIGPTAVYREETDWFRRRPLAGRTILIARDEEGTRSLSRRLNELGADVLGLPVLAVRNFARTGAADTALTRLGEFDWVVFTSRRGAEFSLQRLAELGKDARAFGRARIACIGPETARALGEYGLRADFIPTTFTGQALAEELSAKEPPAGKKFLLLRSAVAPDDLPKSLQRQGAVVEEVSIYTVEPAELPARLIEPILERLGRRRIDWILFASSSAVSAFLKFVPKETVLKSGAKIASIGPSTTRRLLEEELPAALEAPVHTLEGLTEALIRYHD
ncbi:MAG TPA: uroporphyrinogen-III C-methyltransferase [Anaerohalosphaeraceae bacterium]|nr:uroporphyrinogen-III C-methyltransferase [Anaerohalosphaeraceae bacterium]HOL89217.1 uroporphyrinogen-III C-methyltransferase [Anaerohalosphaeraceae bacterium]HPP56303.1 uroporphyrinogen-III C-methyltransferase [Anaerohalosphaeraceae bacterium]